MIVQVYVCVYIDNNVLKRKPVLEIHAKNVKYSIQNQQLQCM